MEDQVQGQKQYTDEWFRRRAFASIDKVSKGVWDFSDSLLLYLPQAAKGYESVQETGTPYFNLITKPEKEYLKSISPNLVKELPSQFIYIDLGPGTEHKEQYIFDEAKIQNKNFVYVPVDINEHFLDLANTYALNQGMQTKPTLSSFEELPERLRELNAPRLVSLGLTFSNYHPAKILDLLKAISGKGGYIFINAQMRDRIDMSAITKLYSEDAQRGMFDSKIQLLGLNPVDDIISRETDNGVRVWYTLKNSNKNLESKGIVSGDKLLVFQSLRYTKESLEKEISAVFPSYILYDTGSTFIGALLKS